MCFIAWCRACIESSGMMLHLLVINQRIKGEADEWGTIALFSDSTISLFVSIEFVIEHYIRRLTMSTRGAECRVHRVDLRLQQACQRWQQLPPFMNHAHLHHQGREQKEVWFVSRSVNFATPQFSFILCQCIISACSLKKMYYFCMFHSKYCTKQSVHVAIGIFLSQILEANYLIRFFTEFPMTHL